VNKVDAIELYAVASAAYPRLQEQAPELMQATISLWTSMLGDLPKELAMVALQRHISMSRFSPTVAEIREHAAAIVPTEIPLGEAAWMEVLKRIQRVGYTGTPTWSHPLIGEAVERMWGNWQNACASVMTETIGVDRAQYCRMFETLTKRHREDRMLPPAVREFTAKLAAKTGTGQPFRLGALLSAPDPVEPPSDEGEESA
jgi:hypothetical protein